MASDPDGDIVTLLDAGGIGLTEGTNLFPGPERAAGQFVPTEAVFVLASGGFPPRPFIDGSGQDYCESTVQITVRSEAAKHDVGQTLARAVRDCAHKANVAGYVDIRVRESEPNYIGQDEKGSHLWTLNVEMEHRR